MLTLEQYRNGEMAALYHNCIAAGSVKKTSDGRITLCQPACGGYAEILQAFTLTS